MSETLQKHSPGDPEISPSDPIRRTKRWTWLKRVSPAILAVQIGIAVVAILAWEILAQRGTLDPFFFSQPTAIWERTWNWVSSGYIVPHLQITLLEAALALVIGLILGLIVGFALARIRILSLIFDPYIKIANALPRVVLVPLFLLWFGLGIWSKVAFGVTLVFFIVFFNTYQGIREVDKNIVANARVLGASEYQLARHVFLPSALTWIFSSLHTSVGFAIVGAVVGEYLGSSQGVGYVISQAQGTFDTAGVFAGMLILSVVVVIVDIGVNALERHLLRWKGTETHV